MFKGFYLGTEVAIKRFSTKESSSFKAFLTELEIFMAIRGHPNIVTFLGGYQKGNYSFIVNELSKKGNLSDFIIKNKKIQLPTKRKLSLAIEIAQGINYLHLQSPPILHRDIKAENILICEGN